MSEILFPKNPFINQTYISIDKKLYYWTGAKWRCLGKLMTVSDSSVFKLKTDDEQVEQPHIEADRLTDLDSINVSVEFKSEFDNFPKGIGNLKVYRMVENEPGQWAVQDVIHFHPNSDWLTVLGFDLIISQFESLPGIIIEYYFTD